MVKHKHITLMLWAVVCSFGAMPLRAQSSFQQLTQRFEDGMVFKAQFHHHYKDAYTGDEESKAGQLWIGKQKYKIESNQQLVAVDGKLSHVYDRKRNRVIISTYDPAEDDFAPSRILNGVDSTYTVEKQLKKDHQYVINLDSDDPFALFKQVQITLNDKGIPVKVFVEDTADNLITTTFSEGKFIRRTPGMFKLTYPDSAKIVDMRN